MIRQITNTLEDELQVMDSSSDLTSKYLGYVFKYSQDLVKTGTNYYESKELIPEGMRMSTAAEELAIQNVLERAGVDPRKAMIFYDLLGKNMREWHAWQWTETGIRIPKGYKPNKYETDGQGRKYWPRMVLIGDKEVGEVLIPEGVGRVIVEWNEVFGLPRVTSDKLCDLKLDNHTTHFMFNHSPLKRDDISGNYDIAVVRWAGYLCDTNAICLNVEAYFGHWVSNSDSGFRPVVRLAP